MSELARFVFQSGHYSATQGRVKRGAFMPAPNGELSVFEVLGLLEDERAQIGVNVSKLQERPAHGWAEFEHSDLADLPLAFVRDDTPIERHGNVVGWPMGDDDESRMARTELATTLAQRSSLVIPTKWPGA